MSRRPPAQRRCVLSVHHREEPVDHLKLVGFTHPRHRGKVAPDVCGLLDASLAANAPARQLDAKLKTSIGHAWFMQGDYEHVVNNIPLAEFPYLGALALAELGRGDESAAGIA